MEDICINLNIVEYKYISMIMPNCCTFCINLNIVEYK